MCYIIEKIKSFFKKCSFACIKKEISDDVQKIEKISEEIYDSLQKEIKALGDNIIEYKAKLIDLDMRIKPALSNMSDFLENFDKFEETTKKVISVYPDLYSQISPEVNQIFSKIETFKETERKISEISQIIRNVLI
jgi:chromosome segregation ATPase